MTSTRPQNKRQRGQYGTKPAEGPGHRTDPSYFAGANPRDDGEMKFLATLVRSRTYRITYRPGAVLFERGKAVAINAVEFEKLSSQYQTVMYTDGGESMRRHLPVWSFTDMDGKSVAVEIPADEIIERRYG